MRAPIANLTDETIALVKLSPNAQPKGKAKKTAQ